MAEMMDVCAPEMGLNMMNQTCKVCGEPAAGFHFGAFTCEGCKSFFGRSYNNLSSISECKNNGKCIIDKKNRTTCKACRLRKCYTVGMSKGGSRYGRRSNWFKIHCLLQEQQQQAIDAANKAATAPNTAGFGDMASAAAAAAVAAKQHMQSLNPHMAAAGGLLGYPGYHLPEMMAQAAPFMSAAAAARHPAADAASSLPFFSMMNSLPNMGSPQSAFQLPPHLLFPAAAAAAAYHPNAAAAAAAAADAAYRSEMYKHRQSVDSAASGESAHRYSPQNAAAAAADQKLREQQEAARNSPELCVSGGDEDEDDELDVHTPSPAMQLTHPIQQQTFHHHQQQQQRQEQQQQELHHHRIHNPIAIRATPRTTPTTLSSPTLSIPVPTSALTPNSVNSPTHQPSSPTPTPTASAAAESAALSFAAKMQSLSPVSVCSIGTDSANANSTKLHHSNSAAVDAQDCPMDLSMKAVSFISRASTHSCNTSSASGDSDMHCESSEEEVTTAIDVRRKFFHFNSEHCESDASSDASGTAMGATKRQKMMDEGYNSVGYASSHGSTVSTASATSLHGIFVCV